MNKKAVKLGIAAVILLLYVLTSSADFRFLSKNNTVFADEVDDITAMCKFSSNVQAWNLRGAYDDNPATVWRSSGVTEAHVRINCSRRPIGGIYIIWESENPQAQVQWLDAGGVWNNLDMQHCTGMLMQFIYLPTASKNVRIIKPESGQQLSIREIKLFGHIDHPPVFDYSSSVRSFEFAPDKIDMMVIVAHPDDEHLCVGGLLPYYAGQQNKSVLIVYMTSSPVIRKMEALNGIWATGGRLYPVFLNLKDRYSTTYNQAAQHWDCDEALGKLISCIRQYKPDIVVTHDYNGEYGHGAHKLTARLVTKAINECSQPNIDIESYNLYGLWQPLKLYIHLYENNRITLDYFSPLDYFNGLNAIDMSRIGFLQHETQQTGHFKVRGYGALDIRRYGLRFSVIGPDIIGQDMFENIPQKVTNDVLGD